MKKFLTSKPFIEASKEFLRVIILAVIPVLISQMSERVFDWKVVAITGSIAGLRWVDKFLHVKGVEGGLTRF